MGIVGNRFKASISDNRKFVDLNDRKLKGVLTLLKREDLENLKGHLERNLAQPSWKTMTLAYPEKGKHNRILAVSQEDARELVELVDKLLEIVVPV